MAESRMDLHRDPEIFREALSYTERDSGFPARLIEKILLALSDGRHASVRGRHRHRQELTSPMRSRIVAVSGTFM